MYKNVTVDDIKKWNKLTSDAVSEGTNLIVGYNKTGKPEAVVSEVVVKEKEDIPVVTAKEIKKEEPVKTISNNGEAQTKTVVTETAVVHSEPVRNTGKGFNGGFFKSLYNEQAAKRTTVEETGTAAMFKSTSGWEDGKYYCLHNNAPAGSIIKITNKATQKSVYAKVLDVIPDLKQNNGIMLRLSNAAADELGAGENNFESIVNF